MILRLDHVGFATEDADRLGPLMETLGLTRHESGVAEDYGVSCAFWVTGVGETAIELVSPTRDDSAVSGRLSKNGPGLYHIALEVDDLDAERERLRRSGLVPLDREPVDGARPGMRVAFLWAPRPADLFVELVHYVLPRVATA